MKLDVKELLKIKDSGDNITLYTNAGLPLLTSYNRVVFGGRGPYVEVYDTKIKNKNIHVPVEQIYRLTDLRVYYVEFLSNDLSNVKVYYQLKTVAYADYKIGLFYISPFDLYFEDKSSIVRVDKINERSVDFFE